MKGVELKTVLSLEELKGLARVRRPGCGSIFMPTHRGDSQLQQNPIRFKNLVSRAERDLRDQGMDPLGTEALTGPARSLLKESLFWTYQDRGLAVLFCDQFSRAYYGLPARFEEVAVAADRFYIKPFFQLFAGDGDFYVLALSQKSVRFFRARRDFMEEVVLPSIPHSLEEALRFEVTSRQPQFRSNSASGRAGTGAFYDQGSGMGDNKDAIQRYLHQVERGVTEWMQDRRDPLVVVGVEYLLPIYRSTNRYPGPLLESPQGNPDGQRADAIHAAAWKSAEPVFRGSQSRAEEAYRRLAGEGRLTLTELRAVLTAAWQGRVSALFIDMRRQVRGRHVPETGQIFIHGVPAPGDEDLYDAACLETLLHGGAVYPLNSGDRLAATGIAAILRY